MIEALNKRQLEILWRAERDLSPNVIPGFRKFVGDILRGQRELLDSDVRHACGVAHTHFRAKIKKGNNEYAS